VAEAVLIGISLPGSEYRVVHIARVVRLEHGNPSMRFDDGLGTISLLRRTVKLTVGES
jgi:hypothetical protein